MRKKILIADDEKAIAEMLGVRLEENGYEVLTAYDGLETLAKARSEQPDLILVDYTLSKLKGNEVSRRLKSDEACRHIPIILMSAYREEQIGDTSMADDFVGKPYEAEELLGKIKKWLAPKQGEIAHGG